MKRILPLALAAVLALGTPAAQAQAITEASVEAVMASLSVETLESSFGALSEMIGATSDPAVLALIAQALTQVAELAAQAGATNIQVAALSNAATASDKASGTAFGEITPETTETDGSPS